MNRDWWVCLLFSVPVIFKVTAAVLWYCGTYSSSNAGVYFGIPCVHRDPARVRWLQGGASWRCGCCPEQSRDPSLALPPGPDAIASPPSPFSSLPAGLLITPSSRFPSVHVTLVSPVSSSSSSCFDYLTSYSLLPPSLFLISPQLSHSLTVSLVCDRAPRFIQWFPENSGVTKACFLFQTLVMHMVRLFFPPGFPVLLQSVWCFRKPWCQDNSVVSNRLDPADLRNKARAL